MALIKTQQAHIDLAKALRSPITPPQTLRNLQAYWLKGAAKTGSSR
jgi:hypothetical protein